MQEIRIWQWLSLGLFSLLGLGVIVIMIALASPEKEASTHLMDGKSMPGMNMAASGQPASQISPSTSKAVQGKIKNFTLYVRDNTLILPDGEQIYVYGFTDDPAGLAKIPGPSIVVEEGDTVNVTLVNDHDPTKTELNSEGDGHTIHFHGLDLPSKFDGDPMTASGAHAIMQGETFTYSFEANQPGTYYYHCHQEAPEHLQMGMYGAFIVKPKAAPNQAYSGTPSFDKEYTFVLSEFDSKAHQSSYTALHEGGDETNWTQYHPNYFLINGKAWPDTSMDELTDIRASTGQKVLVRLINAGMAVHSMHSHGYHFQVLGTDGRKLESPYQKDTITLGPGERYDILLTLNQPGRYMFHDHIEQNNTNDGSYPGGMIAMINVDNPDGSNPVPPMKMEADPASVKEAVARLTNILNNASAALAKANPDEMRKGYGLFAAAWDKSEGLVKQVSKQSYRDIEDSLKDWKQALKETKPDSGPITEIITRLKQQLNQIGG